jgi:hypothetical protein
MSQGRRALGGTAMVATRAIDTMANTVIWPPSRAGSRDIGGRLSLANLRPSQEVVEVIAHMAAVLAVRAVRCIDTHLASVFLVDLSHAGASLVVRNGFSSEFFLFSVVIAKNFANQRKSRPA